MKVERGCEREIEVGEGKTMESFCPGRCGIEELGAVGERECYLELLEELCFGGKLLALPVAEVVSAERGDNLHWVKL